jgi:hypothetical protein
MTQGTLEKAADRKQRKAKVNISRTRAERAHAQETYSTANRNAKTIIKADKRNYVEELAAEAEKAALHGNMKNLYNTTKKLSQKFSKSERSVKDKEGRSIQGEKGQKNRWKEHFRELMNRPAPQQPSDIQPADGDLPINCDEPTKNEILKAIKQLKSGKAAGPNSIPAEALNADTETMVNSGGS